MAYRQSMYIIKLLPKNLAAFDLHSSAASNAFLSSPTLHALVPILFRRVMTPRARERRLSPAHLVSLERGIFPREIRIEKALEFTARGVCEVEKAGIAVIVVELNLAFACLATAPLKVEAAEWVFG